MQAIMRSVRPDSIVGHICKRIATIGRHKKPTRVRDPVILWVEVRPHHEHHVWMTCRTIDFLVVPALTRAEVIRSITSVRWVRACLVNERRRASLDRLGDEQTTVGLARGGPAVPSRLIHSSMTVNRCRERKLAPVGAGPDEACVDIRPGNPVVGRPPYSLLVRGRVDYARVRRINRKSRCAAGRTEAGWETLAGLRAQSDCARIEQRERAAAVARFPDADARASRDLRDCARSR